MNNLKSIYGLLTLALLGLALVLSSCERMKVGYLRISTATYAPDTVYVARNLEATSSRALNQAPWVSSQIQGVAGTAPINYEFVSVKVANGADQAKFLEQLQLGRIFLQGSMILLTQEAVKALPNGDYTLSIRVYNQDHSEIARDVITFAVRDELPEHLRESFSSDENSSPDTSDDATSEANNTDTVGTPNE